MSKRAVTNPFYESVVRDGMRVRNDRPVRVDHALTNPYYERLRQAGGARLRVRSGRPRRGESAGATTTRSVRLPPAIWERVRAQAAREGLTIHAAVRQAVLIWLRS